MVQANHLLNAIADFSHTVSIAWVEWFRLRTNSNYRLEFNFRIIFLKRLVAWYFQRKLNRNANQLKTLRAEKKKIIEKVMDKETYKVALEILNRFADTTTRLQHQQTISVARKSYSIVDEIFFTVCLYFRSITSECVVNASQSCAKTIEQFDSIHTAETSNADGTTVPNANQCARIASTAI